MHSFAILTQKNYVRKRHLESGTIQEIDNPAPGELVEPRPAMSDVALAKTEGVEERVEN